MSTIIAFGGRIRDSAALERFVVEMAGAAGRPRVCYLTVGGDDSLAADRIRTDRERLECLSCDVTQLHAPALADNALMGYDLVYFTSNFPDPAGRTPALYPALLRARDAAVVLAGLGAAASLLFERIVTEVKSCAAIDSGAHLLAGSFAPHYEDRKRRERFARRIVAGQLPDGYGAPRGTGLVFRNGKLAMAVTAVRDIHPCRVTLQPEADVSERRVPARLIR